MKRESGQKECLEILSRQNEFYRMREEEVQRKWMEIKKIRHDLYNSYILNLAYLENGQYEELRQFYCKAVGELKKPEEMICTGNIGVDSILNYKLKVMEEKQISIEKDIKVAADIRVCDRDLNALIGNLLDNVVEALEILPERERRLWITLHSDDTAMLFKTRNPYAKEDMELRDGKLLSTKAEAGEHGFGLKSVSDIVKKYNGSMEIVIEDNMLVITTLLYMGQK